MAERASTTDRGYGTKHQRTRTQWQHKLNAGRTVHCACLGECHKHEGQCTTTIDGHTPHHQWDLGHEPADKTRYRGPECVPCNRAGGAIAGHQRRHLILRDW